MALFINYFINLLTFFHLKKHKFIQNETEQQFCNDFIGNIFIDK